MTPCGSGLIRLGPRQEAQKAQDAAAAPAERLGRKAGAELRGCSAEAVRTANNYGPYMYTNVVVYIYTCVYICTHIYKQRCVCIYTYIYIRT